MEPASPAHTERCTIVLTPRDLFSVTDECLDHLEANTPEPHDLIVAMGGAPASVRSRLEQRLAGRARLILDPVFRTTGELRNRALREATTRLAVCVDNNVFVRPGWLAPLLRCQRETEASQVVPLILDGNDGFHRWKWDIPAVMASYRHIEEKWTIDVGGPRNDFRRYLVGVNARVGPSLSSIPRAPRSSRIGSRATWAGGCRRPGGCVIASPPGRTGYYRA